MWGGLRTVVAGTPLGGREIGMREELKDPFCWNCKGRENSVIQVQCTGSIVPMAVGCLRAHVHPWLVESWSSSPADVGLVTSGGCGCVQWRKHDDLWARGPSVTVLCFLAGLSWASPPVRHWCSCSPGRPTRSTCVPSTWGAPVQGASPPQSTPQVCAPGHTLWDPHGHL